VKATGQVIYHSSCLDSQFQPAAVCATDDGSEPVPLIVELSPNTIGDLGGAVALCEQFVGWAASGGERCVVIKPGQRGPGSVGQGPGEVDVLEAIEWACTNYPIDRDRISVTGASMGGAATWYMASHYPDVFAAAAPFCGYCNYQLWTTPGGHINRTHEWEHGSWQGRGAAYRVENLSNMALWITHGEWDVAIGGGVSVEHSRRMSERLSELGIEHNYTEVPHCGHGSRTQETGPPVVQWLCRQRRKDSPRQVTLIAHTLRHNCAFWVTIEQFEIYGQPARVDARLARDGIVVNTQNVRRLRLGPIPGGQGKLRIDGQELSAADLSAAGQTFEIQNGTWRSGGPPPAGEKRRGVSGPIGDVFFAPQRFVYGTGGDGEEAFVLQQLSRFVPGHFRENNGGIHRGGIRGTSWYDLPFVADTAATEEELAQSNLVLYGSPEANCVHARYRDRLPLEAGPDGVRIAGRAFEGPDVGFACIFPHPDNPDRYLAVVSGNSPEAIAGSAYLNLQLLPDYLVWRGSDAEWGFFGNDWR